MTMSSEQMQSHIRAAEQMAYDDVATGRKPLWYAVRGSIDPQTHVNPYVAAAYVRAYAAAKVEQAAQ